MGILADVIRWKEGEQKKDQMVQKRFSDLGNMLMKYDTDLKTAKLEKQKFGATLVKNNQIIGKDGTVKINPNSNKTAQNEADLWLKQQEVSEGKRKGLLESSSEFQQAAVSKRAGETAAANIKIRKDELGAKIEEGGYGSLSQEDLDLGVSTGQVKIDELSHKDLTKIISDSFDTRLANDPDLQFRISDNPDLAETIKSQETIMMYEKHGKTLPKGMEANVQATMKANDMTREEVITEMQRRNKTKIKKVKVAGGK